MSWLTHAVDATRHDGMIVVHAVHSFLEAFGAALIRHERQTVDRCSRCGSLRLIPLYNPDVPADGAACLSCGWELLPKKSGRIRTVSKR